MKHLLLILTILCSAIGAPAQEMRVRSMRMEPMDLTAATSQRKDLNGVPCAVVKVRMPRGAAFEGSVIGTPDYRTGEYWVYVTAGSKFLRVKHESALPLHISFADHGVAPLESKATYVLDIAMPAAQPAATQQKVEIRFSPADAIVLIDNQPAKVSGNTATATLPADRDYSYIVTGNGYIAQHGTFHLHPAVPTHLNVELMRDPSAQPAPAPQAAPQRSESDILAEADREFDNKNYARAMELYKQIPDNSKAQNRIGWMYGVGHGVSQDYTEAVKWYRKSAEQGYDKAQYNLGYMYYKGQGVSQSYSEAVNWYRKSAEQGFSAAQRNLGGMYYYGRGVTQSDPEAVKWYRKAAEQGDAMGQCNLGYMYEMGKGVGQNLSEAVNWYRKSAEQGYATAQHNLGVMYEMGQGVSQNYSEAEKWYRKAAEQGYAPAQCNLGTCYSQGRGISQDYAEALKWFRKAVEQGDARAQCLLGICYYNGNGVDVDKKEAYRWIKMSADQGYEYAVKFLK